jgi:hypothetical protein
MAAAMNNNETINQTNRGGGGGGGVGDLAATPSSAANEVHDRKQASYKVCIVWLVLLSGRWRGGNDAGHLQPNNICGGRHGTIVIVVLLGWFLLSGIDVW